MYQVIKKVVYMLVFLLMVLSPCHARDFIVEFLEENYRETSNSTSYLPIIYHSIQVNTQAGSKLLILKGDDYHYRKWLRQYIAADKAFVAEVPEDENDLFIKSHAFEINVSNLHPLNLKKYKQGEAKRRQGLKQSEVKKNPSDINMNAVQKDIALKPDAEKPEQELPLKRKNNKLKIKAKYKIEKKRLETKNQYCIPC